MSWLAHALLLGASAFGGSAPPFDAGTTHEVFRANFPEPAGLAAARRDWNRVARRFEERAARGVLAKVEFSGEGFAGRGIDHYVAGNPPRLRELRDGNELVAQGPRFCSRALPDGDWACQDGEVAYGLTPPDWDGIIDVSSEEMPCGATTCRRWSLRQAKVIQFEDAALYSEDPAKSYVRHEFLIDPEGNLMRLERLEHSQWPGAGRTAYEYDYDADIAPIALPD